MKIAIVGAGAWGTVLAMAARRAGCDVLIWAFEPEVADGIAQDNENRPYLPGVKLDPAIRATNDLGDAAAADIVLLAAPAQHLRRTVGPLAGQLAPSTPLVICSKGIEQKTLSLMSEAVSSLFAANPIMILSGPTFASDVAAGLPTAVTLAADDIDAAQRVADGLSSERFRPYSGNDVIGAQIGGAIKNVLAIACGVAHGRGFGDNTRATLITRGLAEMTRLGVAKGGRAETLMGLAGLGDLTLTCTSTQSRNYSLGEALGRGETLEDILNARRTVAEGVFSAEAVTALAAKINVDMPICAGVEAVLKGRATVDEAIEALLSRPSGREAG